VSGVLKIAVGLSGGVDSAVAAWLLQQAGHEVVGYVMRLPIFMEGEAPTSRRLASLSARQSLALQQASFSARRSLALQQDDARRVASHLGVPLLELDLREDFERHVLEPFAAAYAAGLTPNPCALCNPAIKFGLLADAARRGTCAALATGHYAQTRHDAETGRHALLRASDTNQDQSYFLHGLSQEQLAFARFPVGHLSKAEVRALAEKAGIPVSQKRGSRDLCFLPDGDYRAFLRARCPEACEPGPVRHALTGEVLGTHPGIAACTIGQRKGLGIATGEPLFVSGLEASTRTVFVAPRGALPQTEFLVRGMNWISIPPPVEPLRVMVRTRHRQPLFPARVGAFENDVWRVVPEAPCERAAPGQSAVFYMGDAVAGGGVVF